MDKVAIVILNWNGEKMLRKYLPSVVDFSVGEGIGIYVADNASTDDSMRMLKRDFPQVHTIQLEKNWGFAEGYNKALSSVDAELYVLLNSDVEVTRNWLVPLIGYMDTHSNVAFCQPKLLSVCNKGAFEYAGAAGGYLDRLGYPFCRGRIFETVEQDNGQYNGIAKILWATGACLVIRAKDYWSAGGLDGRFFAHNEEIDLCWRLNIMGREGVCVTDSAVYHLGGGTLPKGNPMKTYLNFRNNLTMLYKNLSDDELPGVMRMRCLLDWVAAFQMLLLGRSWGDFKAVLKARRDFRKWKGNFAGDRERIQAGRKVESNKIPGLCRFSILWKYYVKGVRKFDGLRLFL